jgi:hypothetical protein
MNNEDDIPLLEDLISPGQMPHDLEQPALSSDDHHALQIPSSDELAVEGKPTLQTDSASAHKDDIKHDANLKELIIDEEIRMILDKHMDNAYDEIIRLLNRRIC